MAQQRVLAAEAVTLREELADVKEIANARLSQIVQKDNEALEERQKAHSLRLELDMTKKQIANFESESSRLTKVRSVYRPTHPLRPLSIIVLHRTYKWFKKNYWIVTVPLRMFLMIVRICARSVVVVATIKSNRARTQFLFLSETKVG